MREQGRARDGQLRARSVPRRARAAARTRTRTSRAAVGAIARGPAPAPPSGATGGTTHISVVDASGNAASLTASTGLRLGRDRPRNGDPPEQHARRVRPEPGRRRRAAGRAADEHDGAVDRAAPADDPRLVVGSAGSVRLRGAILQAVVNVIDHGLGVEEAIDAPRVHVEEPHVHCEGGSDPAELDALEARGYDVVRWRRRNLYFGGVAGGRGRRGRHARRGGRSRAAAGTGSSSDERREAEEPSSIVRRGAGGGRRRRGGARRARRGGRIGAGGLADLRRAAGAPSPTSAATCRRFDATRTPRCSSPRRDGGDRRPPVDRARPASREPARRRPGADGRGLGPAAGGRDAPCSSRRSTGRARPASASSSSTSSRTTSPRSALYERFGFVREGYRKRALPARAAATWTRS